MPGGIGPGDPTVYPNLPGFTPINPTARGGGGASASPDQSGSGRPSLTTRPSSLSNSSIEGPTAADGLPVGTPRVMAPEQR